MSQEPSLHSKGEGQMCRCILGNDLGAAVLPGYGDGTPEGEASATRETRPVTKCRSTRSPRGPGPAGLGGGEARSTVEAG